MKILIVRTSSMGDLVHTLYAIEDLARYRNDLEVHWICEGAFIDIVKLHPFVKKSIAFSWRNYRKKLFNKQTWQTILKLRKELKNEKYDLVIDSQGLVKSAVIAKMASAPIIGFAKNVIREKLACYFYDRTIEIPESDNVIWKNRQLFALAFDYYDKINRFDYSVHLQVPTETPLDFITDSAYHVVVHGASQAYKLWDVNKWRELFLQIYKQSHLPFYLTWGNELEFQASKQLAADLEFVKICPKLDLFQVAGLLQASQSVLSVDTGLLHLANAFSKPTVGVYCNTSVSNTRTENCPWQEIVGGSNAKISVEEVFKTWQKIVSIK